MVEQVRISPEEVRGYGNVCEEHELDDFTVNVSSLSKVSEEVYGALTNVYKLVYSLYGLMFDFDKGAKQLYLQTNEANTLSLGFDTVNKQLYLVDEDDTGFNLGFDPDTRELYITDEAPPIISISASSPYLVSGETTDLVVSLVNEFGSPVSGKTVTISDGTSLYSGITNTNGLFTLYDVEVSDTTTFTATYSSVSATCKVEYCLFVDYGVTSNNNSSNVTIYEGNRSIQDDGTHVTANANNRYDIRPNNFTVFTIPYEVEFEVVSSSGRFAVQGYNSSTTQIASLDTQSTVTDGDVIRVTFESTTAKMYKNGTELRSGTYTTTGSMKFRIMYNASSPYITYKNLRVKAL